MALDSWGSACDPEAMLAQLRDRVSDRKLRLFVNACSRSVLRFVTREEYLAPIERSVRTVEELVDRDHWMDEDEEREFAQSAFPVDDFLVYGADHTDPTREDLAAHAAGDLAGITPMNPNPHDAARTAVAIMIKLGGVLAFFESEDEAVAAGQEAYEEARAEGASHKEAWVAGDDARSDLQEAAEQQGRDAAVPEVCELIREVFGSSMPSPTAHPSWLTRDVVELAQRVYTERAFEEMPRLADALENAGCDNGEVLEHCRQDRMHSRGCWVVDLLLGKS
jgi:hypothetical protein